MSDSPAGEQLALLEEVGPLIVDEGPPFCVFEVPGPPRAKGRHRSMIRYTTDGKPFIHNYPDPDTQVYELRIGYAARAAMRSKPLSEGPVAVLVHAFMPIPRSWPMRKQLDARNGALLPVTKPDWDNFGKITDALKDIVWKDDAPVCDGRVIKRYSDTPALRVEVRLFVPRPLAR